jgi:hypothetical protein
MEVRHTLFAWRLATPAALDPCRLLLWLKHVYVLHPAVCKRCMHVNSFNMLQHQPRLLATAVHLKAAVPLCQWIA